MKKINWTPFLVLTPIFVLMVIIHYLHYWTPLSILAFMVCFFKAIIFISLDRLLVRIMKIKINTSKNKEIELKAKDEHD